MVKSTSSILKTFALWKVDMKKTKTQATDGEKISQTQHQKKKKKKNQTIQLKKHIRHEQILCQRGYTNCT